MVRAPDVDSLNLASFDFLGAKYLVTPASYPRLHQFMETFRLEKRLFRRRFL